MISSLSFSKETDVAALVFLSFYFVYGIFRLPFLQYLTSLAAGMIAYGITDCSELAAIAVLFVHFLFPVLFGTPKSGVKEGFVAWNPDQVVPRVGSLKKNLYGAAPEVRGVGSPLSEGFEDAKATDHTIGEDKKESANSKDVTATSKPAEVPATPAAPASQPKVNAPAAAPAAAPSTDGFQAQNGLFKLGQIPSDSKGGLHIDAGTTVLNALNALKPDQVAAMTSDTKQLIDTQKSLMGLLQQMSPMLNEGKQMMETFQGMFGPAMGANNAAQGIMGAMK